jgi:hypothetical protein
LGSMQHALPMAAGAVQVFMLSAASSEYDMMDVATRARWGLRGRGGRG